MNSRPNKIVISLSILKYLKNKCLSQKRVRRVTETRKIVVKKAHTGSALPKQISGTRFS